MARSRKCPLMALRADHRAHNPKVAGSNPAPATMKNEGLADADAANPFRLPRLHPGIGVSLCLLERGLVEEGESECCGLTPLRRRRDDRRALSERGGARRSPKPAGTSKTRGRRPCRR